MIATNTSTTATAPRPAGALPRISQTADAIEQQQQQHAAARPIGPQQQRRDNARRQIEANAAAVAAWISANVETVTTSEATIAASRGLQPAETARLLRHISSGTASPREIGAIRRYLRDAIRTDRIMAKRRAARPAARPVGALPRVSQAADAAATRARYHQAVRAAHAAAVAAWERTEAVAAGR